MCAGGYSETANSIKNRKIDARYGPKNKFGRIERIFHIWRAAQQIHMMISTEKRSGYENRKRDGINMTQPEYILKDNHKNTNQNQPENKLFVYTRPDSGYDSCHQRLRPFNYITIVRIRIVIHIAAID